MSCWALIALKSSATAKGRLAEMLTDEERSQLVERMFQQVLKALRMAHLIDGIAVVTAETLAELDLLHIVDLGGGLNAALTHGAVELNARGVREVLILHADLPLLQSSDVDALISAGRAIGSGGCAIASDKLGQGTNALFVSLPLSFSLRFGVGSFALHQAEMEQANLIMSRVDRPGLACDIDEPQDLLRLFFEHKAEYGFLEDAVKRASSSV